MKDQLRVLVITNLFPNNKEPNRGIFIKQQTRELAKLCHLRVIAPVPWFPFNSSLFPKWSINAQIVYQEEINGIRVYHPRWLVTPKVLRSLYGFSYFFSVLVKMLQIRKSFKFDIINAPWIYPDGFAAVLLGKISKKHVMLQARGCDINLYTKYFFLKKMIVWSLRNADEVITVSQALKDKMIQLDSSLRKVKVIYNGVDTRIFRPLDKLRCRNKLSLHSEESIVLFVGSLENVKGLDYLLDAFHKVNKENSKQLRLVIIGTGSMENKVRSRIDRLHLNKAVTLVGEIPHNEMPIWMNSGDLLCLPSIREGVPNVVLEALACGKPVVATTVGGIPEIITSEDYGVLVPLQNSEVLAGAIRKALEKKWNSEALRQSVISHSWEENANELFRILSAKKAKLNILYHHRTQGKGSEGVHIRGIVKSLKELENEVYIVSPPGIDPLVEERPNVGNKSKLAKMWEWISGHLPEIWFELLELAYNFIGYKNIKKIIKKEKIDFIYERYAFFCFAGVYLAKKYNIPIILEVNEISGIKRMRGQVLVKLAKRIEKWVFSKADAIVTVSSFLKKQIENKGINSNNIYVIPNAVNIEKFNPDINGIEIRNRLNLNGKTVLGFVGWFAWWDNLKLLINTLSGMVKEKTNLHLVLIGDGDKREELEYEAIKRGVNNNITFAGKVSRQQMPNFIQAIDICAIPHSNPFGSPVVLFEYMAMGKAVVAPRLGPIEDVITDDVNGVLFEPKDENSLRRCLLDLINDSHKREKIGKEARDTVLSKHLWRHNAERVVQIYNGVIGTCQK